MRFREFAPQLERLRPPAPVARLFAPPEQPGEVGKLGRYRVLKQLGEGGMGAVYLGYDPSLGRKVAIKVILPEFARRERARFLREARAAARVKDDHVVVIYDVGEDAGVPFLAMEYLKGCSLQQYLATKGLPLPHAVRVAKEAALGLVAAHALGVVHRDVKPGNIWLEAPKGRVKLLDFGLARVEFEDEPLTRDGVVVGTPEYMSPEQADGEPADARSDVFSLGCVLYRLLTGVSPFKRSSDLATLRAVADADPAPVRGGDTRLPQPLMDVVRRSLAKRPNDRFQTARELASALDKFARAEAGSGPVVHVYTPMAIPVLTERDVWKDIATRLDEPSSEPPPLLSAPARRRRPAWAVGGLVVSALGGAAFLAAHAVVNTREGAPAPPGPSPPAASAGPSVRSRPDHSGTPDRRVAAWVLASGGRVRVYEGDEERLVAAPKDLPAGPLTLTAIDLENVRPPSAGGESLLIATLEGLETLNLKNSGLTRQALHNLLGAEAAGGQLVALAAVGGGVTTAGRGASGQGLWPKLGELNVSDNAELDVTGLDRIRYLTALRLLHLNGTRVGADVFTTLSRLSNLEALHLERVTADRPFGDGLTRLKVLPKLNALYIGHNEGDAAVRNPGAAALGQLAGLSVVRLSGAVIDGDGVRSLGQLKNLTGLHLDGVRGVSDDCVGALGRLQKLQALNLSRTSVTGRGLAHLTPLQALRSLELANTAVDGAGLVAHVGRLKELERLDVRGVPGLTEAAVRQLGEKLNDCKILWDGGETGPVDRRAAELAIGRGGAVTVEIRGGGLFTAVTDAARLPAEPFVVKAVTKLEFKKAVGDEDLAVVGRLAGLHTLVVTGTAVTDGGLRHLAGCGRLSVLFAASLGGVTDEGVGWLRACPLERLHLANTGVTDGCVPALAAISANRGPGLTEVNLDGCGGFTDASLAGLGELRGLRSLNVKRTKVTASGVRRLAETLPDCRIESDWAK